MRTLIRLLLLPIISATVLLSCNSAKQASSKRLLGKWQSEPIVMDGKNTEWPSSGGGYDEEAMLGYLVTNDKDNLYIMVHTGDLATQLKILNEGLTVWIDRKGEKNEVTAINFPIPADTKTPPPAMNVADENLTPDKMRLLLEDKVKAAMAHATEYSLQGFKACNLQYPVSEKDTCGIMVRMDIDADNELVWEAVIPFRAFYFKNAITSADRGRALSLTIETTGAKRPKGSKGKGSGGRRQPTGRPGPAVSFGMGGMGMGMNMGGGNGYGYGNSGPQLIDITEQFYISTKTWVRFGLGFQ